MWDKIVKIAQSGRPRIAIGLSCVNPEIEEILKQASKFADMVVMGQDVAGYQSEPLWVSGRESVKDRLEMTEKVIKLIRQLGREPKIGVISDEQPNLGV
jgi:predicted methyltransferase MtxX (methanogen marker protein 4)